MPIHTVLFDYGGVLAEEGFRQGLLAIAGKSGLDPEDFFATATETIYDCGYTIGKSTEAEYWRLMRQKTGIAGTDEELTAEILSRFTMRPRIMDTVKKLRGHGSRTAILSDQTDWLDRLEARFRFSAAFDFVFNSYHLGKTKRDPSLFDETVQRLGVAPHEALFIDDNPGNTERAISRGLQAILFQNEEQYLAEMQSLNLLS